MLIVLNALDQSKADAKSEFVELIADKFPELPTWTKLLILSRQQMQIQKQLGHFNLINILPYDPPAPTTTVKEPFKQRGAV